MIAPNSIASRKTIEPVTATTRRIGRGYARPSSSSARHLASEHAATSSGRLQRRAGVATESAHRNPLADQRKCTESVSPPSSYPVDLRRSDCRAGEPSTFGAPCSVHSETYVRFGHASSTIESDSVANCDNLVCASIRVEKSVLAKLIAPQFRRHAKMHRGRCSFVRPPDRPPPKRLPLGGPSTSGAPSSVQLGH